jgi:class 3 adenylate cyclase
VPVTVSDQGDARVRVSDAERDAVVTTLRGHFETGRLTFDEFSDRVDEAYTARTAADLDRALRELPRQPSPAPLPTGRPRGGLHSARIRAALSGFALPNGICIGVWAASTPGGYFWPIWVLIPTGAVCLSTILAPGRHHHHHDRGRHGHGRRDERAAVEPFPPEQRAASESPPRAARVVMSVLFVDIVGSTRRAAALGDAAWHALLADYEREVAAALQRHRGDTLFTKGDEVVAGFALPAAAVECALDIRDRAKGLGLEVRAGVHAGEVDRVGNQANGIAMHIGRRVCEAAAPSQVLVSSTVHDLLAGSGLVFDDAGEQELKGLSGSWRLYQPQS